jgi:formamidopyrimidine-DNA glycosylase
VGKRIVFELTGELFVVVHLMIAGRFQLREAAVPLRTKLDQAGFDFERHSIVLTEAGTKKRASLHVVRGEQALSQFDRGGVEPLAVSLAVFCDALQRENRTLKRALTDPRLFSGIGNAYSDEILHSAKLSPVKRTASLTKEEMKRLHQATRKTLKEWTKRLRVEAADGFPAKVSAFRQGMAVHGRYKEPCPVCETPVQRIRFAQNEVNYCPNCQTGGKLLADRALSRLLKADWPKSLDEFEEHLASKRQPARRVGG